MELISCGKYWSRKSTFIIDNIWQLIFKFLYFLKYVQFLLALWIILAREMKNYDLILILLYFILNTQPEIQILKGNPSLILLVGTNYKIKGRFVFSPIKGCLVIFHKKPRWLFDMKHRFLGINVILFFAKNRVYLHSFSRNIWNSKHEKIWQITPGGEGLIKFDSHLIFL